MGLRLVSLACGAALLVLWPLATASTQSPPSPGWLDSHRAPAARLIAAATADDVAWQRLAELTDTFGSRLSGSENLERALAWARDAMLSDGLENVRLEPVMVPRWIRGHERAEIVEPPRHPLALLGLGGTVATPPEGIEGEVLAVRSFEELRDRAAEARGRIVLLDVPYSSYAESVHYRTGSARAAAQYGALAVLVRSIAPPGLRTPHTGSVQYAADQAPIPAAALAAEDANRIARMVERGQRVRVRLVLEGRYEADAESANLVGEIVGRDRPGEVVLLGCHIDSWDVGTGASDDAVGCIVTWEAARLMGRLGLRPRRTVRVVLFTNEENGLRGASAYLERYGGEAANHVLALESDSGVFEPAAIGFSGSAAARAIMLEIGTLLAPLGFPPMGAGGGGADIGPIAHAGNVPTLAYLGDPERYFVIHHTAADTVERIAPGEVSKAVAAIAVLAYVVAEMPERLPR